MKSNNTFGDAILILTFLFTWLAGISIETGWSAFFSIIFPPYAWYSAVNYIIHTIVLK